MPRVINRPDGTVTVRIFAGSEWKGVKHFEPKLYNLSPQYATHAVEVLRVAEYVAVNDDGDFEAE